MQPVTLVRKAVPVLLGTLIVLLAAGWSAPVGASVVLDEPDLPPEPEPRDCDFIQSLYIGSDVHALFPGGIDFSDPLHECFTNVVVTTDPNTGDETETFDSQVKGNYDDGSGAGPQPVILTGPVQIVVRGKGGATTGSWQTEILSMDLSGDVGGIPIQIRESPAQPSPGQTSIAPRPDGTFQIDSFFDVFIELSVAGGPFQPQTNPEPGRMTLTRAGQAVELDSPDLPPESDPPDCDFIKSLYIGKDVHSLFPNGVDFSNPRHRCFKNVQRSTDPVNGDETETSDTTVDAVIDLNDGTGPHLTTLSGPVTTLAKGKGGATTGSWQTEILSMDLSGDVGGVSIEIRESPSLPSPGETSVLDPGDGTFQVDSFFDVFVELSVNGGPFQPQTNGAGRMELVRAGSGVVLESPDLPPEPDPLDCDQIRSQYVGISVHALFPGPIDFSNPLHECFKNVARADDGQGNEIETFDTTVKGTYDDGSGSPEVVTLTGPVEIKTDGKTGNTTGSFQTEILSMSLTGSVGGISIEIRESPSLPSPGQTTITDLGGGLYEIDSFFDVFVELSVDGGAFQPQTNGAGHMELMAVGPPVPAVQPIGLYLMGALLVLLVAGLAWRQRVRA